jgi:tetratricopeptide (TPR) repeat protein
VAGGQALERGDYPRAEELYRQYLKQHPNSAEGLSNLAAVLARREKFDEAIATYEKALRINPRLTPIYFNLAVAYLRSG